MTAKTDLKTNRPRIGPPQIRLLERLCNACAVSGDEEEVRTIVLEQVRPHVTQVKIDALGNVLVTRQGQTGDNDSQKRLRVLLAAHMDEVGFMITTNEGDGTYRFESIGGVDERQLVGKPVWVGREHIPGVIGAKPIHLTTPDELKRTIPLESLRIDTGLGGNTKVKVGDRAVFSTTFTRLGPSLRAKALDDRVGVATLIELIKYAPPNLDILAAFTVQEEVGLRGARVAGFALQPDLAIAIDATPALDMPSWEESAGQPLENTQYRTRLDNGPAIYIADAGTLSDPRLIHHLVETAESLKIPYQFRQAGGGGTDAGALHISREGVPSISVSVPERYAHTAAGLIRLSDWQNTFALLHASLSRMMPDILSIDR